MEISVGNANNVWGVNAGGQVYYYDNSTQSWMIVPGFNLQQVYASFDGSVWGLDGIGNLYQWNATTQSFSLVGLQFTNVSVGNAAAVWVINSFTGTVLSWF